MKLGIIFKKEFREEFGDKREFFGDEITILKNHIDGNLVITSITGKYMDKRIIPINFIQLIYFGGWKD